MRTIEFMNDKRTDFSRQSTSRKLDCDYADNEVVVAMALVFSVENLINCVHNEHALWDVHVDSFAEDKELAWHRVATKFSFLTAKQQH